MKKKKCIITICIIAAIVVILTVLFLVLNRNKITISFNTDGGTEVSAIKIKKGESIELPISTKDDYIFDGWYLNDKQVDDKQKYEESATLTAKWTKLLKTFTITFDSKGGSKVKSIVLEEGKELKLPANPKKDGYKFIGWYDKNDVAILDGALLSAEDITLTAKWEKVETKKETKKETTKKPEVSYTCEKGWTLNGDKCEYLHRTAAKFSCPSGTFEVSGKCVYINGSNRIDTIKKCKSNTYPIDNKGHTKTTEGILITIPSAYSYCVYGEVTQNDEQSSSTTCSSRGHVWANNKCYYSKTGPGENMELTCKSGYTYISNPNSYSGVNGLNVGCFKTVSKVGTCQSGYNLSGNNCLYKEIKNAIKN